MSKLNVLYQSNEAFVIPLSVSLLSLYENNKDIDELNVYIIDDNIEDVSKKKIEEISEKFKRNVIFLNVGDIERFLTDNGVGMQQTNSYTTFFKIFSTHLLSDLDKILYIDADTVVLGSLKDLCDEDLEGYGCGMVNTAICGVVKKYLRTKNHFNGGVIYLNLNYWRENDIYNRFRRAITCERSKYYNLIGDESLFNMVLKGHIKKLPLKYNFESSWWLWGWNTSLYGRLGWNDRKNAYYSLDEIKKARNNPTIAHYINLTTGRPWEDYNDNPFKKEFEYYLKKLNPWKGIELNNTGIGAESKMLLRIKYLIRKVMPFKLRSYIGFVQHEKAWKNKIVETKNQLEVSRDVKWNEFEKFIEDRPYLKTIDGNCEKCPLRKQCEKAHHVERIHGIIDSPAENTGHPAVMRMIQRFSFVLYLIPKRIFKMWSGYDNNTLGCPSHSIVSNLGKYKEVYNILTDKDSKDAYIAALMFRLTHDNKYLKAVYTDKAEYFGVFNGLSENEVVVDCGGYIGDTLEEYLEYNKPPKKYLVFEPDRSNIEMLNKNIERLNAKEYTEVYVKGVGEKEGTLYINSEAGMASQLEEKSENSLYAVDIVSIDSLNRNDITFIKMDIEGAEPGAIKGATKTLTAQAPKLAICLYHTPTDLFEIPLLIKKICPRYNNFVVKQHDRYNFTETILYVWES